MRVYNNNIQQAQLWPALIGNTSSTGILQTAMRHVAHNLGNMTKRSIEIDNLRIETVPINRLKACPDNPEAEAVGIYLLINGDLSGEAIFGNLALSSFLNAVADLSRVPLRLSPPAIVLDTLTVIFEAVAMSALTVSDKVLIIKTDFVDWEDSLKFQFWVLPDFVSQSTHQISTGFLPKNNKIPHPLFRVSGIGQRDNG